MNLKELREQHGISQGELSRMCEVQRITITAIEAGRNHPSVKLAKKLGLIFGVDWWRFYDDV